MTGRARADSHYGRWLDPDDPRSLPDALAPASMPDLTHRALWTDVELTGGRIVANSDSSGGEAPDSFAWIGRPAAEIDLSGRRFYAGLAAEGAFGKAARRSDDRFVMAYPEAWLRAVYASQVGIAYGGGIGLVAPVFKRSQDAADGRVAETVRVVRPWQYAAYAENTFTVRPFLDARVIDGKVTLQVRQAVEIQGLVASVRRPRTGIVSQTTLFIGYRALEHVGVGLEMWETYFINADNIPDEQRAVFAVSPSVRWLGRAFQPALSVIAPFDRPLFDAARSYLAARLSLTYVFDPAASVAR